MFVYLSFILWVHLQHGPRFKWIWQGNVYLAFLGCYMCVINSFRIKNEWKSWAVLFSLKITVLLPNKVPFKAGIGMFWVRENMPIREIFLLKSVYYAHKANKKQKDIFLCDIHLKEKANSFLLWHCLLLLVINCAASLVLK